MDSKATLDSLASELGTPFEGQLFEGDDKKKQMKKMTEKAKLNDYVYGGSGPIPGESISDELDAITNVDKSEAMDSMIMQSAMLKAKAEAEEQQKNKKMTPEERKKYRQQVVDYLMYQQEEQYFMQHKYIMDGKTKRRLRSKIERDFDKGRIRPKKSGHGSLND